MEEGNENQSSHLAGVPPLKTSAAEAAGSRSDRGGIVTARGTGEGLVLRVDGRVERSVLIQAIRDYVSYRTSFLGGQEVTIEWVSQIPEDVLSQEVLTLLTADFKIKVKTQRLKEQILSEVPQKEKKDSAKSKKSTSLFDGIESLGLGEDPEKVEPVVGKASSGSEAALWDDADARILYSTLRSGQKIETVHSLVIIGDVNSGAEIVAGGDIIVLGTLRGVAHAGAYDETGGGRFIFAQNMEPTQLRIGSVISRGSAGGRQKAAEIARVDGNLIAVMPYQARTLSR